MLYKSDLRTGMKVKLRDGCEYIVLLNMCHEWSDDTNILIETTEGHGWLSLDSYNDDLTNTVSNDYDIIEVFKSDHLRPLITDFYEVEWTNIQTRKMTLEEIENALGYKVEIIS